MITGVVNADHELTITLKLHGKGGEAEVTAVIDTGFNGFLTLPPLLVTYLGCLPVGSSTATLADGSQVMINVYEVEVEWNGDMFTVEADTSEFDPLVGMALLYGHKITVEAVDGGAITIEKL